MLSLALSLTAALAQDPTPTAEAPAEGVEAPVEEPGAEPITYGLDPAASWLYVVVYNDQSTLASRFGHDHGIRASTFDGTVVWDLDDPSACQVDISFPVTALTPDPPGMRERASLAPEGAVGDDSKETIKANLLKRSQLDGDSFPRIAYKATSCDGTTGTVKVTGELSIRGVGKSITVPMTVTADATTFKASGRFTANHSDFGFKPFTNLGGALKNKDELVFVVDVVGKAR